MEKATETNPGDYSVAFLCRALKVSRSGYYAYHAARPAAAERERQEEELVGEIRKIHARSRRAYGAPRITAALKFEARSEDEPHPRELRRPRQQAFAEGLCGRVVPRVDGGYCVAVDAGQDIVVRWRPVPRTVLLDETSE
ncbi:IS3 family transposase [Streptomyces sp. NPDC048550]|uniref:IS3 family transposase n=1 Tax=Streptomyces sp. NPDC048550 TaxID=3155739 RepID=UPI003428FC76